MKEIPRNMFLVMPRIFATTVLMSFSTATVSVLLPDPLSPLLASTAGEAKEAAKLAVLFSS